MKKLHFLLLVFGCMLLAALILNLTAKKESVKESASQPLATSANPPVIQPDNQSADVTLSSPVNQSVVQSVNTPVVQPVNSPLVGGDRDAHGCIGSAGYSWCDVKQKCLRPWEEICNLKNSSSEITANSEVMISKPLAGAVVTSPLMVTGRAKGTWFFEASLPVKLVDATGLVIAATPGQAQSDWMTEAMVPFKAELTFTASTTATSGYLIIAKDNPSGLPENAAAVRIPVKFK